MIMEIIFYIISGAVIGWVVVMLGLFARRLGRRAAKRAMRKIEGNHYD